MNEGKTALTYAQDMSLASGEVAAQGLTISSSSPRIVSGSAAPAAAPRYVPPGQHMSGAINICCADGHVERSLLESLWSYCWYNGYVAPAQRPP